MLRNYNEFFGRLGVCTYISTGNVIVHLTNLLITQLEGVLDGK